MIANAMAVVHLLNTVVDVYLWLDDKIQDVELHRRISERKKSRIKYITEEKLKVRLEILRDLERNPK
jgi:hypothetical protein